MLQFHATAWTLHEVIDGFISIFTDQLKHALYYLLVLCLYVVKLKQHAYLGHDRFAIFTLYIAEGHFSTLMLVDLQIGGVKVGYLGHRYYNSCQLAGLRQLQGGRADELFCSTTMRVTRTAVSVVICTGPRRRPSKPFLRSSDVRSLGGSSPENNVRLGMSSTGLRMLPTENAAKQENVKCLSIFWREVLGCRRIEQTHS